MSLVKLRVFATLMPTDQQRREQRASLSGTLFLQIGETFFPSFEWHDLTSCVLARWVIQSLSVTSSSAEIVHDFMDGPYRFGLQHDFTSHRTTCRLYEQFGEKSAEEIIDFPRYLASLRGAAKGILNEACAMRMENRKDFDDLQSGLKQIVSLENAIRMSRFQRG